RREWPEFYADEQRRSLRSRKFVGKHAKSLPRSALCLHQGRDRQAVKTLLRRGKSLSATGKRLRFLPCLRYRSSKPAYRQGVMHERRCRSVPVGSLRFPDCFLVTSFLAHRDLYAPRLRRSRERPAKWHRTFLALPHQTRGHQNV